MIMRGNKKIRRIRGTVDYHIHVPVVDHGGPAMDKFERMKKTQLLYFFLFIFCFHVNAQEAGQCKNDVMQSYQLLSKPSDAYPGMHMKYTIQNAYWEPIPEQKQEITYLSNLKLHKTLVRTNDYTIYTDKKTAVTISHQKKTIMITANPAHGEENGPANHFLKMRDSIIMKSQVEECKSIVSNGQTYRQIKLLTHDSWKHNTHIHHLMFWIDQAKHIKKISILYTKAHQWKHITLTMEKTDYSYRGNVFNGSAVQQIYTGRNTLRPEYKEYKIMNLIRK